MAPELSSLDALETDLLVLPFFEDERPLRGASGLVDWRLCGALSKLLRPGHLSGRFGERSLVIHSIRSRLDHVLLLGLGQSDRFDGTVGKEASVRIVDAACSLKSRTTTLTLPGRSLDAVDAAEAMQHWLEASSSAPELGEITIMEDRAHHAPLAAVVDGLRRQAESPLA